MDYSIGSSEHVDLSEMQDANREQRCDCCAGDHRHLLFPLGWMRSVVDQDGNISFVGYLPIVASLPCSECGAK